MGASVSICIDAQDALTDNKVLTGLLSFASFSLRAFCTDVRRNHAAAEYRATVPGGNAGIVPDGKVARYALKSKNQSAARLGSGRNAPGTQRRRLHLHGPISDQYPRSQRWRYVFTGQSPTSTHEANVGGMYYGKDVDVLVARDKQELGVISIKFVISNYWQNSINYLEQQIGETANLRRRNIVYGNLFCVTNPIPYKNRSGEITRREAIRDHDIQRYARLRADHEHIHAPDEMAIGIVDLDTDADTIPRVADPSALDISEDSRAELRNALSLKLFFVRMARRIELRHLSP
jgi:hypothetical protein